MNFVTQLNNVSGGFWIKFTFPQTVMELLSSQLAGYTDLAVPTVLALELYAYIIYKTYKLSKEKQDLKPFILAVGIYFAVIIAAIIITQVLNTSILYYRYLFVITGLYIFAVSFILGKEENKVAIFAILSVIAILGIYSNINMMKNNYSSTNNEPIDYIKEKIQEDDIIVFEDIGTGFVTTIKFAENNSYFYNKNHWGVEEAYKAFGPNFDIFEDGKKFTETNPNRIWVVDNAYGSTAQDLYGDENKFKSMEEKQFFTNYHGYHWKVTLIERVK